MSATKKRSLRLPEETASVCTWFMVSLWQPFWLLQTTAVGAHEEDVVHHAEDDAASTSGHPIRLTTKA